MISVINLFEEETIYYVKHIDDGKPDVKTSIPPEKRSLKNLPRFANKKPMVRFQDWLELSKKNIGTKSSIYSYGWSPNGKCYGWSHRAIFGFYVGYVVKPDTIGNNTGKEFTIKTKEQAEEMAIKFAEDVS